MTGTPHNDEIPESWKARFESVTGDHPPSKLGDATTESQGKKGRGISRVVINTVQQIEAVIK